MKFGKAGSLKLVHVLGKSGVMGLNKWISFDQLQQIGYP